jgi:DNA invertase Pin-like site-specific DNA recombinase
MSESKVSAAQLRRAAVVYVRQSTMAQLSRNRESTARQYDLVGRAVELGWPRAGVRVIDEDLGVSGASAAGRAGFAELAAQVGLGQVGIVLALEVSRLARNNADWYRLLDLAGMTDTLIADTDGVYHPGLFNDRMLLGMKGTMSEAELHILRARLHGGIRSKAARGQLRRALPVGLVWGEADGDRLAPRRSRLRGDRGGLRAVRGVRVGARGVAVAARSGVEVPAAAAWLRHRRRGDHLGGADLPCGAHRAHPSRLRGRLHLRPHPRPPQRRRRWATAHQPP